jgi:hypothetical protein
MDVIEAAVLNQILNRYSIQIQQLIREGAPVPARLRWF